MPPQKPECDGTDNSNQTASLLEALFNLNYLIGVEANKPAKVRAYAKSSDERLRALADLIYPKRGETF
jgi:hypothetical protein